MPDRLSLEKNFFSWSRPVSPRSSGEGNTVRFSGLVQSLGTALSCERHGEAGSVRAAGYKLRRA
jgi:hypothetical protein